MRWWPGKDAPATTPAVPAVAPTALSRIEFLAHDLRSPIASVLALVDALRDETNPEVREQRLDQLESCAEKALHVADQMFQLLRLEALPEIRHEPLDFLALVENAIDTVQPKAVWTGITLALQHDDPASFWVRGQGDLLEQALTNLLDNAVKYSHPGGRVEVRLSVADGQLQCLVRDHGIGMDAEDMAKLFTHYGRLRQAPPALAGAGLGLHFARQVALRHAGSLAVESVAGQGSCFTLTLPATGAA